MSEIETVLEVPNNSVNTSINQQAQDNSSNNKTKKKPLSNFMSKLSLNKRRGTKKISSVADNPKAEVKAAVRTYSSSY